MRTSQTPPLHSSALTNEAFIFKVVKVLVGVEIVAVPSGPGRQPRHVTSHPDGVVARRAAYERRLPEAPDPGQVNRERCVIMESNYHKPTLFNCLTSLGILPSMTP